MKFLLLSIWFSMAILFPRLSVAFSALLSSQTAMISGMADVQRNARVPVRVVLRARLLPGSIARFVRPRRQEPFSLPVRKSRQRRRRGRLRRRLRTAVGLLRALTAAILRLAQQRCALEDSSGHEQLTARAELRSRGFERDERRQRRAIVERAIVT